MGHALAALLGIHFPNIGFFHWLQGLWWPEQNRGYAFTSSVGSDIGELTLIGGMIAVYRSHTCHVDRCFRLGRHHVDGTPYKACRKHHPTVPSTITAQHVSDAHSDARDEIHDRHHAAKES
jgi:hypothetical protein